MLEILQPNHRVLEMGCGTGSTALELAEAVDHYLATDVSSEMIEIARAKSGPDHLRFEVRDAHDPLGGPHDVILALNLLHLVEDLEAAISSVFEALPSGGLFITKTALMRDGLWVLPMIVPLMQLIGKAPYVRNLKEQDYMDLLTDAGFVIDEKLIQSGMVPRAFVIARKA